jgi:hypothetical protein
MDHLSAETQRVLTGHLGKHVRLYGEYQTNPGSEVSAPEFIISDYDVVADSYFIDGKITDMVKNNGDQVEFYIIDDLGKAVALYILPDQARPFLKTKETVRVHGRFVPGGWRNDSTIFKAEKVDIAAPSAAAEPETRGMYVLKGEFSIFESEPDKGRFYGWVNNARYMHHSEGMHMVFDDLDAETKARLKSCNGKYLKLYGLYEKEPEHGYWKFRLKRYEVLADRYYLEGALISTPIDVGGAFQGYGVGLATSDGWHFTLKPPGEKGKVKNGQRVRVHGKFESYGHKGFGTLFAVDKIDALE